MMYKMLHQTNSGREGEKLYQLTFKRSVPRLNSLKNKSSTVGRCFSLKVLNKNRRMIAVLPTPPPPRKTRRTWHDDSLISLCLLLFFLFSFVARMWRAAKEERPTRHKASRGGGEAERRRKSYFTGVVRWERERWYRSLACDLIVNVKKDEYFNTTFLSSTDDEAIKSTVKRVSFFHLFSSLLFSSRETQWVTVDQHWRADKERREERRREDKLK